MSQKLFLHDVTSHVMDAFDLSDHETDYRRAVRSAIAGFRNASMRHRWNTYESQFNFTLNAPFNVGTISVDAAGTAVLTPVAGEVWPDWAEEGSVAFTREIYRVIERVDDTTLRLESWRGTDLTDSAYKLVHNRKLLPHEPRMIYDIWNYTEEVALDYVVPEEFRASDRFQTDSGGYPYMATTRSVTIDDRVRQELRVAPFPLNDTVLDVAYNRFPDQPSWAQHTGIVMANDQEEVSIRSTLPINRNPTGAYLRLTDSSAQPPDAQVGYGFDRHAPVIFEGEITEKIDNNTIKVAGIPEIQSWQGIITDALDIPEYAFEAVLRYAEANMSRLGTADLNKAAAYEAMANEELRFAMEQEPKHKSSWSGSKMRIGRLESMQGHYIVETQ